MQYLSPQEVLVIHALIIDATGGRHGVRDIRLLKSACARPAGLAFGKELYPNILQKAAVYLHAFVMHHVFVDGNKRTAIAVTVRFLETNGYTFCATSAQIEKGVLDIVTSRLEIAHLAEWLGKHSKKI